LYFWLLILSYLAIGRPDFKALLRKNANPERKGGCFARNLKVYCQRLVLTRMKPFKGVSNMTTTRIQRRQEEGFTLVELAIVMIIIGLLITGILKGQEMIANAQVTATVSQVKGLDAATSTFRDMYDAMPGDMPNANVRLPNCTGTCATAGGGDGRVNTVALGAATTMGSENRTFFTHLAAADLISGVSPAPTTPVNFGDELPTTEIGSSGFIIGYTGNGTATSLVGPAMRGGHYLAISPNATAALPAGAGTGALTASQAARIDRKLDDGKPNTGVVRAGGSSCTNGAATTSDYNEANDQKNCNTFIRIQG
jgi:prepilin-type N-terminal cleavage/methylation domain-containing protein